MTDKEKKEVEELQILLFTDTLTQSAKRELIEIYENIIERQKTEIEKYKQLYDKALSDVVRLSKADARVITYIEENRMLEENYQLLIENVSYIAKELNLEEDATIDEIIVAIRKLQIKANKYDSLVEKIEDNLAELQREYEILSEHQSGQESNRTKYLRGKIHM